MNASATFMDLMNKMFRQFIDQFFLIKNVSILKDQKYTLLVSQQE